MSDAKDKAWAALRKAALEFSDAETDCLIERATDADVTRTTVALIAAARDYAAERCPDCDRCSCTRLPGGARHEGANPVFEADRPFEQDNREPREDDF